MMKKFVIPFLIITLSILYTNNLSAQFEGFFSGKIKGEKSEYNVNTLSNSKTITISNVNNTWGTEKFPYKKIQDYGGSLYTKDDYINIYRIIKNIISSDEIRKLEASEKFSMNDYMKSSIDFKDKLNSLTVFVVYYPFTGKVYEVFFSLSGEILKGISPDYFYEIEKKIKDSIVLKMIIETNHQFYIQCRFSYTFNDLDAKKIKGERIILSDIN
jgi:hypothetical protein